MSIKIVWAQVGLKVKFKLSLESRQVKISELNSSFKTILLSQDHFWAQILTEIFVCSIFAPKDYQHNQRIALDIFKSL